MVSSDLWKEVLKSVSNRISKPAYETWIAPSDGNFSGDNKLKIEVQSDFAKDWIGTRYSQLFLDVLKEITGEEYTLEVIANPKYQAYGLMLNEEQAMGYFMLACREANLPYNIIKQLHSSILSKFEWCKPHEAERGGIEWLDTLKEEDNQKKIGVKLKDLTSIEPPRRSVNLKLPKVSESNTTKRIRAQNRKIIKELEYTKNGPFGLYELFRRCKK